MNRTLFNTLTCLARMLMIPVCCFLFFQCGRIKTVRETPAAGELRLPAIFSDNMVLQRDKIIQIWGWDAPGEKVVIILDGKTWSGKAGSDGRWSVAIGPLSAGGPWTLNISDSIKIIAFKNVLAGEVWACSGQSNMEMHIGDEWGKVLDYEREIAESDYPQIRLITIPHQISFTPQPDANTDGWVECSPKTSPSFSAAAYFLGARFTNDTACRWGSSTAPLAERRLNHGLAPIPSALFPNLHLIWKKSAGCRRTWKRQKGFTKQIWRHGRMRLKSAMRA